MKGLTPARLDVLKRACAAEVLTPLGPDWYALYWLEDHGLVEKVYRRHTLDRAGITRFVPTAKGRQAVAGSKPTGEKP